MFDITALGELLIDFTPRGASNCKNYVFEANPGGAPCNVLAQASRLGKKTAFIGKVGQDAFGQLLRDTLKKEGIGTQYLFLTKEAFTTLAFVTLSESGDRTFSFARNNSADTLLSESEIAEEQIKNSRILHCGTLSLTHDCAKRATIKALELAKKHRVPISTDPNLRLSLWDDVQSAKEAFHLVFSYGDIIKISDNEVSFFCNTQDILTGAKKLYEAYQPKIMFVTCGKEGAFVLKDGMVVKHEGFVVNAVDTTGAGDSFCGAALTKLLEKDLAFSRLTEADLTEILCYANACAAISATRYGAISIMPTDNEVTEFLKTGSNPFQ